MFPKIYRLQKNIEIKKVLRDGNFFSFKNLILKQQKNNKKITKFAFIVSKKINNRASVRNKIKRILREEVKKNYHKIKNGYNVVIIVRPSKILNIKYNFKQDLDKILIKSKLIDN